MTTRALKYLGYSSPGRRLLRVVSGSETIPSASSPDRAEVFGLEFANRVGLAAGFDKGGELLAALPNLGFGFAEIGTVTPRPQPGNDRPRLFRDAAREAVFNRMGFNNPGAVQVARRIEQERQKIPLLFRVGINVGKNKDTPAESAHEDYAAALRPFHGLVDYAVINVSSPNTPGLRDLQAFEQLCPILESAAHELTRWRKRIPLLVKLAPELEGDALMTLLDRMKGLPIDGWVLTNTLVGTHGGQSGGWSGRVLTERSRLSLQTARQVTQLPMISVGGIMDGQEACRRLGSGASLIQIYSAWILSGPRLPADITREIRDFLIAKTAENKP